MTLGPENHGSESEFIPAVPIHRYSRRKWPPANMCRLLAPSPHQLCYAGQYLQCKSKSFTHYVPTQKHPNRHLDICFWAAPTWLFLQPLERSRHQLKVLTHLNYHKHLLQEETNLSPKCLLSVRLAYTDKLRWKDLLLERSVLPWKLFFLLHCGSGWE